MSEKIQPKKVWRQSNWLFGIIVLLILTGIACNLPVMASKSVPESDPGFVETSVAQTLMAVVEDVGVSPDESDDGSAEDQSGEGADPALPTATFTPEVPTFTPTITDTPTPQVAMVYASANTNCRKGQGTAFGWLTSLEAGDEAEAVGVENTGEYPYWYIRRPDQPSSFCWLWGKYATPSGPYEDLPVMTPMPTPTPGFDFEITFTDIKQCISDWYVNFQIKNTGSFTYESWRSTGDDKSGSLVNTPNQKNSFFYMNNCTMQSEQTDLEPGEGSHLNVVFNEDSKGHDLAIKVKVCTGNGLSGECQTKSFNITP